MRTLRLRPWVKVALAIIVVTGMVALACARISAWREEAREAERLEVEEYKACIMDQHKSHGWIVRSDCSYKWRTLDEKAGFTYEQRGYDIYLSTK